MKKAAIALIVAIIAAYVIVQLVKPMEAVEPDNQLEVLDMTALEM